MNSSVSIDISSTVSGVRTERRIAWLTLAIGFAAAAGALAAHRAGWAAGLFVGSVLAWINFRWLRRGLDALVVDSAAQAGSEKPSVHTGSYTRFALRYVLMGLCIYAIFEFLKIPLASMFVGLCALGAAVIAASVYEILRAER